MDAWVKIDRHVMRGMEKKKKKKNGKWKMNGME